MIHLCNMRSRQNDIDDEKKKEPKSRKLLSKIAFSSHFQIEKKLKSA